MPKTNILQITNSKGEVSDPFEYSRVVVGIAGELMVFDPDNEPIITMAHLTWHTLHYDQVELTDVDRLAEDPGGTGRADNGGAVPLSGERSDSIVGAGRGDKADERPHSDSQFDVHAGEPPVSAELGSYDQSG